MAVLMMQNTIIDGSLTTEPQKPHRHSLPFIVADFRKYPMPKRNDVKKRARAKNFGILHEIYIHCILNICELCEFAVRLSTVANSPVDETTAAAAATTKKHCSMSLV